MASVAAGPALLRIRDLAGRPRGSGFVADDRGTVLTSHEAVDGLGRLVLHPPGGRSLVVPASAVTPLPEWDLALIRTPGLPLPPLVIAAERAAPAGLPVLVPLDGWTTTAVTEGGPAVYTATDRFHPVPHAVRLALPPADVVRLRLAAEATGGPVLDAATGAVLAVLGTALHSAGQGAGLAVPLHAAARSRPGGPLQALLRRNGAAIPGSGADLNLAGVLQLTDRSLAAAAPAAPAAAPGGPPRPAAPADRPETAAALDRFADGPAVVFALVGPPGTGRSTVLAAHAARRRGGAEPAPTVWLRGADLRAADTGLRDAVGRRLAEAARGRLPARPGADPREADPDVLARIARGAGRPLLVVLDAPEEMPPALAARLRPWTAATTGWLRAAGARLALACRPEFWEQAGRLFPPDLLHAPAEPAPSAGIALPGCHRIGDLPPDRAAAARAALGLGTGIAPAVRRHPLALRLLAAVRAAQGPGADGSPGREEIFAATLDLAALRLAERRTARDGAVPAPAAQRRHAAHAAGRLHEAARRSLGPVILPRREFDEVFPRAGGWARAVLDTGVLVPAGDGYRFADEEFADWLHGRHLDLDAALDRLLGPTPAAAPGAGTPGTTPVPGAAPPDPAAAAVPVPRHRIGPVVFALLRLGRERGAEPLRRRLQRMIDTLDAAGGSAAGPPGAAADRAWWAWHLLGEVLLALPDATGQLGVARQLAARVGGGRVPAESFGPGFWRRLALPTVHRLELLRLLLPADPRPEPGRRAGADRHLTTAGRLLAADPHVVQPLLCRWFEDERPLPGGLTVARAAQALLHTHRHRATGALLDALADTGHPRAAELLTELAEDEPAAFSRAVLRWATDDRPGRRAAAARYAPAVPPHVTAAADRELLRRTAEALLARPAVTAADADAHTAAFRLLLHDRAARTRWLPAALRHFAGTAAAPPAPGSEALADALLAALPEHPGPVLAAFRRRLLAASPRPGGDPPGGRTASAAVPAGLLAALATVRTPALARPVARLVREYAGLRPRHAPRPVAGFVEARLRQGPAARAVLRPLVAELLREGGPGLRAALARVLDRDGGALAAELRRPPRQPAVRVPVPRPAPRALRTAVPAGGRPSPDAPPAVAAGTFDTGSTAARGAAGSDNGDPEDGEEIPVRRWHGLADIPGDWGRSVVTIGSYDGVHRGHQLIVGRTVERARELGVPAVVVTFDPHPREVIRPGSHPPLLAPHPYRAELLAALGVDAVLVLPFTTSFSQLSPPEFVVKVLVEKLHARTVVEGPGFRFGHRAAGTVATLAELGETYGFDVEVVDLVERGPAGGGEPYSSSLARRLIAEGEVATAADVLGRPHVVQGTVVRGARRGRELGFPTANLDPVEHSAIPADGVYAGWLTADGERMPAAVSVGTNPQFDGTERTVEAYALDRTDLDLYGREVTVEFLAYLRGQERFDSVEALKLRMAEDVAEARRLTAAG